MSGQVQVIKHDTIPPLPTTASGEEPRLGAFRDFAGSVELRRFIPANAPFAASWINLDAREVAAPRSCAAPTLVVACSGSGEVTNRGTRQAVKPGDVVVLAEGCLHGLEAGPEGLRVLNIEFTRAEAKKELDAPADATLPSALHELFAYNEKRAAEFRQRPLFEILTPEKMATAEHRESYLAYRRAWLVGYQNMLYARQANCVDPTYATAFLRDFHEELTRHVLLPVDHSHRDPVIEAIANWFSYQMYIGDDVEKVVITHLVMAGANEAREARELVAFGRTINNVDSEQRISQQRALRSDRATALLRSQTPETLTHLEQTVGEAWDMIGAMADRIAELISEGKPNRV